MNPTPSSPEQVSKNPDYQVMTDYVSGSYYPSADEVIVKHVTSNTFWRAVYRVHKDDSDYSCGATWYQVVPETVTIIRYKSV